ncbi:universal stress protein [Leptothoe sp. PORK10 BA2]|uniref:universal stress protein n=1 Tax=Leptothoe sp. PORK10 BA2 TaxID=3110254 RepID=UPI002B1F3CC7|nr:universal stress protein [Leptothoe sp. PORK10 BA2]MEA5463937.1 universal stress protein [Leptothoe sp. PORK10 BA2]
MFKKILVALDHSETSTAVFDAAVELAQKLQASLMLVHVLSSSEDGDSSVLLTTPPAYGMGLSEVAWNDYSRRWQAYEEEGLEKLRGYQQLAQAAGLEAEFSQNSGMPGKRLCDVARLWNADLILIGSRGRQGLSELFMGSVSNYVTHHATCSVLVIHPQRNKAAIVEEKTAVAVSSPEAEALEVTKPVA